MSSTKTARTAREYFEAGIASRQWSKPFDLDATARPAGRGGLRTGVGKRARTGGEIARWGSA